MADRPQFNYAGFAFFILAALVGVFLISQLVGR